jgi:signal peptidase I
MAGTIVTTDDPLRAATHSDLRTAPLLPRSPMSLVTWNGAPAAPEGATPPVQQDIPVMAGDLFVAADKDTARTSGRSRSKPVSVERTILTVIAYLLVLAILGAAGVAAVALVRGTWMVTPVLSGSMRPGLSVGGVVVSERVPVASLHVRDVIIFRDPYKSSEQIVHRIVLITEGPGGKLMFNTQGDANNVRDPWTLSIQRDSIYRARWSVPLIGYIALAYQNHRGFFLLGAGIVLILIAVFTLLEARQGRQRRHSHRAASAP